MDPENSERDGRDTCALASNIDTFYFSENSLNILSKNSLHPKPTLALQGSNKVLYGHLGQVHRDFLAVQKIL